MANMNPVAHAVSMRDAVVQAAQNAGSELAVATTPERQAVLDIAKLAFPKFPQIYANVKHYKQAESGFRKRNLICVVAKMAGAIVGYIFYQLDSQRQNESYIKEMGVDPARQGKGIGTYLLAYMVGEAKDNGRSAIKLYTTNDQHSKQGYYANFGFNEVLAANYDVEGYTTDDDEPDKNSVLMAGDVNITADILAKKLKLP